MTGSTQKTDQAGNAMTGRGAFEEHEPEVTCDVVHFRQVEASGSSERVTRAYPENIFGVPSWDPDYIDQRQAEFDPTGGNVGTVSNYQPQFRYHIVTKN